MRKPDEKRRGGKTPSFFGKTPLNYRLVMVAILVVMLCVISCMIVYRQSTKPETIPYTQFLEYMENGEIQSVKYNAEGNSLSFCTKNGEEYTTQNPKYTDFKKTMLEAGIEVTEPPMWMSRVFSLTPLLFLVFFGFLLKNVYGPAGDNSAFENDPENAIPNITLNDVKGLGEVKADLGIYIDFLKDPEKYKKFGCQMPKGILFNGPPGTGKTLLARAIAGEAGVPFKSVNASDFNEIYQGLGALRVRMLFKWAKKNAPCIIFIDELDAVGNSRENKNRGEESQTLAALLTAIDGFDGSDGVFVMAATNRKEDLDPALIRAKRFDHHIVVPLPSTAAERREIIDYYANGKKFADDVNFDELAKDTMGCSPATISSLIEDAALIAAYKNLPAINADCIETAWYKKITQGHEKKTSERSKKEISITAWHEAGHALVAMLQGKEVRKVSIIPSTSGVGGYTNISPEEIGMKSKKDLEDHLVRLYAGQVAEELYAGSEGITVGAYQDIQDASHIINGMISSYGMSEFGMLNLNIIGMDPERISACAVSLSKEMRAKAKELLESHRESLTSIVDLLIAKETISGEDILSFVWKTP